MNEQPRQTDAKGPPRVDTSERAESDLERRRREHVEGLATLRDADARVKVAVKRKTATGADDGKRPL